MHFLDESHIFLFLAQLFVILLCARGLGELFRRWKQPALTAELLVGIALGPTLLGRFWPGFHAALFPPDVIQQSMLETVAWLGCSFSCWTPGWKSTFPSPGGSAAARWRSRWPTSSCRWSWRSCR